MDDPHEPAKRLLNALIESTLRQARPARRWSTVLVGALMLSLAALIIGGLALVLDWSRRGLPWRVGLIACAFALVALAGADIVRAGLRGESAEASVGIRLIARLPADVAAWTLLLLAAVLVALGRIADEPTLVTAGALGVLRWVSFFAQLAFHEWGHFSAARSEGWPVLRVVVGPLALVAEGGRYRLVSSRDWRFLLAGAVFYRQPAGGAAPRSTLRVAAAGPIYTALLGIVLALLGGLLPPGFWSRVVAENVGIAAFTLVVNLVPLRFGEHGSDGLQIRQALRAIRSRPRGPEAPRPIDPRSP